VLGYFSPFLPAGHDSYKKAKADVPEEELDHAAEQAEEFTTTELLKHLETL
jgi:hypothetical protein